MCIRHRNIIANNAKSATTPSPGIPQTTLSRLFLNGIINERHKNVYPRLPNLLVGITPTLSQLQSICNLRLPYIRTINITTGPMPKTPSKTQLALTVLAAPVCDGRAGPTGVVLVAMLAALTVVVVGLIVDDERLW
jgi:hypothetical protein